MVFYLIFGRLNRFLVHLGEIFGSERSAGSVEVGSTENEGFMVKPAWF